MSSTDATDSTNATNATNGTTEESGKDDNIISALQGGDLDYEIFEPKKMSANEYFLFAKKSTEIKMRDRLIRVGSIFCIPVIVVSIGLWAYGDDTATTDLSFSLGFALEFMFAAYFIHLFMIVSSCVDRIK